MSLVSNNETFAFTTQCKLHIKLCATFYKELKSIKNMCIGENVFFQTSGFAFCCVKMAKEKVILR